MSDKIENALPKILPAFAITDNQIISHPNLTIESILS